MTERARFFRALFSGEKGDQIKDVKFFLGDARNISQEDVYRVAADALMQRKLGHVKPVSSIDGNIERISVDDFLSS